MNCCEFERRLQSLLDEREQGSLYASDLPSPLRNHAEQCASCSDLLGGYRALFDGLATARPQPSAFRAEDVVVQTSSSPRRFRVLRTILPLATAASLMIAAWLVQQSGTPDPAPDSQVVLPVARTYPRSMSLVSPMELDERSLELMLNLAGLSPVTFSAELLDSHLVEKPAWMVQVTDGLKPVTERMTGTLNALLRVLPGADSEKEPSQGARYDQYSPFDQLS